MLVYWGKTVDHVYVDFGLVGEIRQSCGGLILDWKLVMSGVLQGLVLNLLLFVIYVNYLDERIVARLASFLVTSTLVWYCGQG